MILYVELYEIEKKLDILLQPYLQDNKQVDKIL